MENMREAGHVACTLSRKNSHKVLVGSMKGRAQLNELNTGKKILLNES
jgi:hypothetical protein